MNMHIRSNDVPNYTQQLAKFLADFKYESLPANVIHAACKGILDWLGCAFAASNHPALDKVLSVLKENSDSEKAIVIGRKTRLAYTDAALLNGQMGHLLDYDDTHMDGVILHASSPILAALFAASEYRKSTGHDFIAAYVAGFEAGVRIGQAAPLHHAGGWHLTGTLGTFAAAAAVGKLFHLNEQQMNFALGIAGTQAAGMQQSRGTMCKSFHAGRAASNGFLAALLAKNGFDSTEEIIEGKRGFARIYSQQTDLDNLTEKLGEKWMIATNGHKPYACGVVQHPVIDAIISLREQVGNNVSEIQTIELWVHPQVISITGTHVPTTGLHSKFSIYHSTAVAMIDGAAGIAQYSDSRAADPMISKLRGKINVVVDESLRKDQARARVLVEGNQYETLIEHAIGTTHNPMSDEAIESKFLANTANTISKQQSASLIATAWNFDQISDIRDFIEYLR